MEARDEQMALLLRVITHDLLSPLTAVKWYAELLAKRGLSEDKAHEYLTGIADGATLGISITKRIGVAGRLLAGAYGKDVISLVPTRVLTRAAEDLVPQFARHGLSLTVEGADTGVEGKYDEELVALLVWSLLKYYLTCVAAPGTVSVRVSEQDGAHAFVEVLGTNIKDAATRVEHIQGDTAPEGGLDQSSVFTHLLNRVAREIGATVSSSASGDTFTIRATL